MTRYVAFIRAISVPGHRSVRMDEIKEAFEEAGCRDTRTYIQSGNVIFEAPGQDREGILERVRTGLHKLTSDKSIVLFRELREIKRIVRRYPFKGFDSDSDAKLYVAFLSGRPGSKPSFPIRSQKERLEAIGMKNLEAFIVSRRKKNGFYGFPNNFIEKELGVSATSRNWTTIKKIAELAGRK